MTHTARVYRPKNLQKWLKIFFGFFEGGCSCTVASPLDRPLVLYNTAHSLCSGSTHNLHRSTAEQIPNSAGIKGKRPSAGNTQNTLILAKKAKLVQKLKTRVECKITRRTSQLMIAWRQRVDRRKYLANKRNFKNLVEKVSGLYCWNTNLPSLCSELRGSAHAYSKCVVSHLQVNHMWSKS